MASTNTPSVRWVVGETTGLDENNETAPLPTPFFQATNTTVPTAAPAGGANVHITSDDDVYLWNGTEWVGPYVTT
jgi:hypothetical protein